MKTVKTQSNQYQTNMSFSFIQKFQNPQSSFDVFPRRRAAWRRNWNIGEFNCKVCQRCRRSDYPLSQTTIPYCPRLRSHTISTNILQHFTIFSPYFHHMFTIFSHMFTIFHLAFADFAGHLSSLEMSRLAGAYRLCAASNTTLGWWSGASPQKKKQMFHGGLLQQNSNGSNGLESLLFLNISAVPLTKMTARCLFNSSQHWPTVFGAWPAPKVREHVLGTFQRCYVDSPPLEDKKEVDSDSVTISSTC